MAIFNKRDRRRYKRKDMQLIINCYLPDRKRSEEDEFKCHAQDISPKGIKLIASNNLRIGYELVLVLNKPTAHTPMLVRGRIRWIKKLPRSLEKRKPDTELGVEFLYISSYGERKLDRLIRSVEKKNRRLNA